MNRINRIFGALRRILSRHTGLTFGAIVLILALWLGWFAFTVIREEPIDDQRLNARTDRLDTSTLEHLRSIVQRRAKTAEDIPPRPQDPFGNE